MKRSIRVVVALLALAQAGCVVNGRWVELTPEQAALHVEPPRQGEQRFALSKPAPEGALVLFENVANPPREPDSFKVGFALVRRESFGWAVHTSAIVGGNPSHGILFTMAGSRPPDNDTVLFGKIVDTRVNRVRASFSSGQQMQDETVNGLFSMFVVPNATLCRLELMDTQGERVQLLDLDNMAPELVRLLDGPVGPAQQECRRAKENSGR